MDEARSVFSQCDREDLDVEELPDGSVAIYDRRSRSVHSLNASAAVIWHACSGGATLRRLSAALESHLGRETPAEEIVETVALMQELGLIVSDSVLTAAVPDASRRAMLATLGTAVPVVLTLTAAEQKGYAQSAGSVVQTTFPFTTIHFTTIHMTTGRPSTTFMRTTASPSTTLMRTTTSQPTTRIPTTTPIPTTPFRSTTRSPFPTTTAGPGH
jgi:hypothetical protein